MSEGSKCIRKLHEGTQAGTLAAWQSARVRNLPW